MKRIPEGLKKISKDDFVKQLIEHKELDTISVSFKERSAISWDHIDQKKNEIKHSIRW